VTEGIRPNKNLRAVEASAIQNPSEHSSFLSGTRSRNRIDRVSSILKHHSDCCDRSTFLLEQDHALSLVAFTLVRISGWTDRGVGAATLAKPRGSRSRHHLSADLVFHFPPQWPTHGARPNPDRMVFSTAIKPSFAAYWLRIATSINNSSAADDEMIPLRISSRIQNPAMLRPSLR
jgi:hypothetical protein